MEYIGFIHRGHFFFFLPAPGPSAAAAAYHRCLCAGAGGLRSCSRSIDCRHITGRQMCVAFLPPAPPKSSIQVVLTKKNTKKNPPKKPKQNKRTQTQQQKNQTKQNKIKKILKITKKKVKPAIFGSSPNTSCTKIFLQ